MKDPKSSTYYCDRCRDQLKITVIEACDEGLCRWCRAMLLHALICEAITPQAEQNAPGSGKVH